MQHRYVQVGQGQARAKPGDFLSRKLLAGVDAEAGGGLLVAMVQLSLTAGAAIGGLLFDSVGYRATFEMSAILFGLSAVFALLTSRWAAAPKETCWRAVEIHAH